MHAAKEKERSLEKLAFMCATARLELFAEYQNALAKIY